MFEVTIFFIVINALSLTLMYMDKYYAKNSKRRIRESRLLSVAFLGGSLGAFMGMKLFRHKTRHAKFKYGLPVMMIFHLLLFFIVFSVINELDISALFTLF